MSKFEFRKLNGAQFFALRDAILDSFDPNELDEVLIKINQRRLHVLIANKAYQFQVNDLIDLARRRGWLKAFVNAMQQASRGQPIQDVESVMRMLDVEGHPHLLGRSLERTVKERSGFEEFAPWVKKLAALRRNVCSIEYPTHRGIAYGTGFLVGPDRVLTNYHVVKPPGKAPPEPSSIVLRFDYAIENGVEYPGHEVKLAAPDWNLKLSPYSKVDPGDVGGEPAPEELDFALLKLAEPIGTQMVSGEERGWIDLSNPSPAPDKGEVLFIIQHPKGEPLKLAIGAATGTNANKTRVRYDANTEGGSSGSPCFDAKLKLVAIHHGSDPAYWRQAEFNQGVPIALISPQIPG